jgi:hypothetical protein
MKTFIQRFSDKITGVLNGFDRLVLRGTLRRINFPEGMKSFLCYKQVLLKNFGPFVERVTTELKEASCRAAHAQQRPVIYLKSSKTDKDALARKIAEKEGIRSGLIAVLTCVEPCMSYELRRNAERQRLELKLRPNKCLYIYHYLIDPQFGFMNARIQSWFPFSVQICLNGREWLSRQMDEAGIAYRRLDNCFPWIEGFDKAQQLMDRQSRIAWRQAAARLAQMLNPIHDEIFEDFTIEYYWSVYQDEWASDIAFKSISGLAEIYPTLVLHAMTNFSSRDVLRFLGRRPHWALDQEVTTDFKQRREGVRVKHRVGKNSLKFYDKFGIVLRTELTMGDPSDFKVFRRKENDPRGKCAWLPLRMGVSDLRRRAHVSQAANERYFDALAAADTSIRLGDLVRDVCTATTWKGKRIRALRPWSPEDVELFRAVNCGDFSINGFRNRDLQALLFKGPATSPEESKRRSGRISRLLRMLRAHHLIKRVPSTYRYVLTAKGSQIINAILTTQRITLHHLNRAAA